MGTKQYIDDFFYRNGIAPASEQDFIKIDQLMQIVELDQTPSTNIRFQKHFGIHRRDNHCLIVCVFLQLADDGYPKARAGSHFATVVPFYNQDDEHPFCNLITPFRDLLYPVVGSGSNIVDIVSTAEQMFNFKFSLLQLHLLFYKSKNTKT